MDSCGDKYHHLLAIPTKEQLRKMLEYMLDEEEFLSPYGIRSVSKYHKDHPLGGTPQWRGAPGGLRARRIQHLHVWGATVTGGAPFGSRVSIKPRGTPFGSRVSTDREGYPFGSHVSTYLEGTHLVFM